MTTQPKSGLYLVIVNYFSNEMVGDLLRSLDLGLFSAVCVVDNSDHADEGATLSTVCEQFSVRVVVAESNLGFGAAVNLGVTHLEMSNADYLWILNPDTIPDSDCARSLRESMLATGADFVSPLIVTGADRSVVWFSGGKFDVRKGRTEHFVDPVKEVRVCNFLTGAALMVRVSAWIELDGFREDLFMYWEDADLSIRAARLGLIMIVDPGARVWHAVGATSSDSGRSTLFYYYMQRNRIIVLREEFGVIYCLHPLRVLESLRMAVRALREPSEKLGKARCSIQGFVAGLRTQRLVRDKGIDAA
ncbi:hypothetical protein CH300_06030 [Rhodococcus sp. 15-1154-1]|nr:glycosyltransferase family 2 protein [Rhodococcus sp. 15-1154-1]OZF07502.1 hypothetical protein CH300_06030 [Rhodococcus sp. 15-1154-1]